jgi:hypothetical protein
MSVKIFMTKIKMNRYKFQAGGMSRKTLYLSGIILSFVYTSCDLWLDLAVTQMCCVKET